MMKKWQTENGYFIHHVLWGRSNAYIIKTDQGNILIDTGPSTAYARLTKHINISAGNPELIDLLILTHSHFDHCQNARALKEKYKCKILMGRQEAEYARRGFAPLPKGTGFLTNLASIAGNILRLKRFGFDPFEPDILVDQNYDHPNFDSLSVIPTPGHSRGSISILVNNEIALVGDTLFGVFKNSAFPPFADDVDKLMGSWQALLDTGCTLFLPGHGRPVTRDLLNQEYDKYSDR